MSSKELYYEYESKMQRKGLFKLITEKFQIEKGIYPGSFIHISPSFYIPEVLYIDSDKKAKTFFADEKVIEIVESNKIYPDKPRIRFYGGDFNQHIPEEEENFDLLISQYAGPVSQACKKYLKSKGILLVNNSHGDAQMAYIDDDYSFIGVIKYIKGRFRYLEYGLDQYFIPKKKSVEMNREFLSKLNKGLGFTKIASHYVFKKTSRDFKS